MASGSSQVAHSTSAPLRKHDVFLSFYGKDTRKGFADHLYTALKHKGIFVFRDDEELKRGKNISELFKAIQESEYAVVVISENYAFSKWCLKELAAIVKCKRENRLTILPVFYHVDPSNVRNQKGSFADGLAKHGEEPKEEWGNALKEVGNIAGWHVHDSYESTPVQEICREIFVGLSRHLSTSFKDVVGIESQVKEMMTLLRARANDVHFIGICGMGGIGKTTLAQVIFDNICSEFEASCFVDDIREKLNKFDIVHLQEQIIYEILGDRDIKIWSHLYGTKVIANRLQDKKIFIVLDNVDKASQIEALAKSPNWFGRGSRILLTSRDRQLLEGFVDEIYEVKELSDDDALRLFCLKALKKNHPVMDYENLSREFVDYAQGLPLALKVFGSLLLKKTLLVWESTLKQLKEEPHIEIWDKLKISFDDLSYSQQELFLDIACFFNSERVDNVIQYLESVGYYPNSNIEVLQDRSLIKVFDGIFKMHDLLQEMGHGIVRGKSLKDPGECSRLWLSKDIIHVLKNNTGTDAVKGIFLRLPLPKVVKLNFEGFSKMKKLKMLVIRPIYFYKYDTNSDETFECLRTMEWFGNSSKFILSNELHVLEWWGYPLECLPTNFEPDNLIEFKIPMSNIKQLWNSEKNFEKLKYIDLRDSQNLVEMPNFNGVPNLEKLDVKGTGIRQFSSSVVLPDKLKVLYVGGRFSKPVSFLLHNLPLYLKFLGELDLSYCNLTDGALPNDLGCLSSLWCLDLSGNKFTRIDCVSKLLNLCKLRLRSCERLKALPPKLSSRLDEIDVHVCPSLLTFSDPRNILTSSEKLVASDIFLQGFYFGYDGKSYCSMHLAQSFIKYTHDGRYFPAVTWGPTLTSNIPEWFTSLPDISGMFQRRFEVESDCQSHQATEASLYYDTVEYPNGYSKINECWGYALFIVYEVLEFNSYRRKGEIHEVDEKENFSSTIFPGFVCELEVHKINDRKVPTEYMHYRRFSAERWRTFEKGPRKYSNTLGKVRIVLRVPDIPSVRRNGVWVFIDPDCFREAGLEWCDDLGLCSISISSLNVEVKECGGRLVLKHDLSECYEIIRSISPHDLDSITAQKALYKEARYKKPQALYKKSLCVIGPNIPMEKEKEGKGRKMTSSGTLMDRDMTPEAFYFGKDGKRYRTYHLAQSMINDLYPGRHSASVTWGPTLTPDIPEWFTNLPNVSGMFQQRFEAEANSGCFFDSDAPASLYYEAVEDPYGYYVFVSGWGFALFIVYEVIELDSCQGKGEIHEVDEYANSSSTIFPVFVCELEVHGKDHPRVPEECWRTLGKVRIIFRVPDVPSVGRNGAWVFINGNCFKEAGLKLCNALGLCSISISSQNVEVKGCGGRLVLKHDHSECYEIIKRISLHTLDSETLKDAFYEGGFTIFGDIIPGETKKEAKEQKGVEIYEEEGKGGVEIYEEEGKGGVEICEEGEEVKICERGEEEEEEIGIEICEEREEKGVKICERGEEEEVVGICEEGEEEDVKICKRGEEEEGVEICERREEEEGGEVCCVSYLWNFFSFLQVGFKSKK